MHSAVAQPGTRGQQPGSPLQVPSLPAVPAKHRAHMLVLVLPAAPEGRRARQPSECLASNESGEAGQARQGRAPGPALHQAAKQRPATHPGRPAVCHHCSSLPLLGTRGISASRPPAPPTALPRSPALGTHAHRRFVHRSPPPPPKLRRDACSTLGRGAGGGMCMPCGQPKQWCSRCPLVGRIKLIQSGSRRGWHSH